MALNTLIKVEKDGLTFNSLYPRERKLYNGIELEFDGDSATASASITARSIKQALNEADIQCNIVSDGSLRNGYEVVIHPCTYSVLKDRGATFTKIFRILQQAGYNNDNQKAGGHIHVSRRTLGKSKEAQKINIDKIINFFIQHRLGIKKYSQRDASSFNQWSAIHDNYRYPNANTMSYHYSNVRYQAINLNNKHTVEFRFFNAPISHSELLANLQLTNLFVTIATSKHKSLDDYNTLEELIEDHAKSHKELYNYWRSL